MSLNQIIHKLNTKEGLPKSSVIAAENEIIKSNITVREYIDMHIKLGNIQFCPKTKRFIPVIPNTEKEIPTTRVPLSFIKMIVKEDPFGVLRRQNIELLYNEARDEEKTFIYPSIGGNIIIARVKKVDSLADVVIDFFTNPGND